MDTYGRTRYLDMCKGYRIFSIILATAVYLTSSICGGNQTPSTWWIGLGMLSACFIGERLHRKIAEQKRWTRVFLWLEIFAYVIFTLLSGGFLSPYIWYCLGCLLILTTKESCMVVIPLGILWCFLCYFAGKLSGEIAYQEINICLGIITVFGALFVQRLYISQLDQQRYKLSQINLQLLEEKERSEQAFLKLSNLYEIIHLFELTDPDQMVDELTVLLRHIIAPRGCILMKIDADWNIEYLSNSGIEKENTEVLTERILSDGRKWYFSDIDKPHCFYLEILESIYEVMVIDSDTLKKGIFIRLSDDINRISKSNESFFIKLIEIMFHSIDVYRQIERYIATEEQNRIANEIHDTVIQKLFGVACNMKVLELEMDFMDQEQLRGKIEQMKQSIELTIKELRGVIYGRGFENGAGSFFADSLRSYMKEAERLSNATVKLMIEKEAESLTAAQKLTVYRIACEAVNNAIRHGKADQIEVNLIVSYEIIKMTIKDNGLGFSMTQTPGEGKGLKNMRRMAGTLKGDLTLETQNNKGTTVILSIPR